MSDHLLEELMQKHSTKELCQRILLGKMIVWMVGKDDKHPAVKDHYFALLDDFLITDEERQVFGMAPRPPVSEIKPKRTREQQHDYVTRRGAQADSVAYDQMWRVNLKNPMAMTVLLYMTSKMRRETNVYVASGTTLAREIGVSSRTIQTAIRVLKQLNFVQVLKAGNTNAYVINTPVVAWHGERGLRGEESGMRRSTQ